ncbi:MAG: hypothetical protein AAF560_26330 [Acidobacteriota bacterium]
MNHFMGRTLWVAALLIAGPLAAEKPEAKRRVFEQSAELTLAPELQMATDVRWAEAGSAYLAVMGVGGVALPLSSDAARWKPVTPDGRGSGEIYQTSRIGVSSEYIAVASGIFTVGWKARAGDEKGNDPGELDGMGLFEMIEDLDVSGDRLAILGTRRGDRNLISPDGAIAWTASMPEELGDLEPVLFSLAGSGARPVDSCGGFEIGALRFLPDGHLAVAPGAEPGVYLYDPEGKLAWTWETEPLGLDLRCDFDDDQRALLSANPLARWSWLQQFRNIDDILPLPDGPGLLIRTVTPAGARWQLTALRRDRPAQTVDLPLTSPAPTARLRADLEGDRAIFLLFDQARFLPPGPKRDAAQPVRLITGTLDL